MGGRFCNHDQTSVEIMYFRPCNWLKTKKKQKTKKVFAKNWSVCFPNSGEDQK